MNTRYPKMTFEEAATSVAGLCSATPWGELIFDVVQCFGCDPQFQPAIFLPMVEEKVERFLIQPDEDVAFQLLADIRSVAAVCEVSRKHSVFAQKLFLKFLHRGIEFMGDARLPSEVSLRDIQTDLELTQCRLQLGAFAISGRIGRNVNLSYASRLVSESSKFLEECRNQIDLSDSAQFATDKGVSDMVSAARFGSAYER